MSTRPASLARLIAPATPRGILLLNRGRQYGRFRPLGPVRLIRQMLIAVILLLAGFVVLATSPYINSTSGDVFRDSGTSLLLNELFYLCAGGLGAAFYALFTAYQYIAAGTYDTTYESSYWIRFILGLIAGVLLPSLIPISSGNSQGNVTRPLLALLGGFSAAVLYRILSRLVQTVESLAEGDEKPTEKARQEAATARALAQMGEDRLAMVAELVHLRDELAAGDPNDVCRPLEKSSRRFASRLAIGRAHGRTTPGPVIVRYLLNNVPTVWLGVGLVVLCVGLSLLGLAFARRRFDRNNLQKHQDVAGFVIAVVGVIYAVLLAFVVVIVWETSDRLTRPPTTSRCGWEPLSGRDRDRRGAGPKTRNRGAGVCNERRRHRMAAYGQAPRGE